MSLDETALAALEALATEVLRVPTYRIGPVVIDDPEDFFTDNGVAQNERVLLVDNDTAAFVHECTPDVVLALIAELRAARGETARAGVKHSRDPQNCPEMRKPGGCQLHNLHCLAPACFDANA